MIKKIHTNQRENNSVCREDNYKERRHFRYLGSIRLGTINVMDYTLKKKNKGEKHKLSLINTHPQI